MIPRFTVVQAFGGSGGFPRVTAWYSPTGELPTLVTAYGILGVTMNEADGLAGDPVAVMKHGRMTGIDDSLWTAGDRLWADPNTGTVTNVKPAAPLVLVSIGVALGSGNVAVDVQVLPLVTELSGVLAGGAVDLGVLIYSAALGYYLFRPLFHSGTVTADYDAVSADNVIACDASGGAITVSLPASGSSSAMQIHIKKVDTSANVVTINPDGSEEIEGLGMLDLESPGDSVTLQCDGVGWVVLASYSRPGRWEDLRFPAQGINPPGAAADPGVDDDSGLLVFSGTQDNVIVGAAQMPHAWAPGTAVRPHIHLRFPTEATANTRWRFSYDVASVNGDFTNVVGTYTAHGTITIANPVNDLKHSIGGWTEISMTGQKESAIILWKVERLASSDAADTDTSGAYLVEFDIHYQTAKEGTYEEYPA